MATAPKIKHEHFPVREISLKALVIDDAIQSRVKHDVEHQRYFAGLYAAGRSVAPPTVFENPETFELILADGFHRTYAAIAHGLKSMPCEIRPGNRDDAYVYSAGANQEMSLKRTPEDIKKACYMLFALPEWWNKGDLVIGAHVGCERKTIQKHRKSYSAELNVPIPKCLISPSGRPIKLRPLFSAVNSGQALPPIQRNKTTGNYYVSLNGKSFSLGSNKSNAQRKLIEIYESNRPEIIASNLLIALQELNRWRSKYSHLNPLDWLFAQIDLIDAQTGQITSISPTPN